MLQNGYKSTQSVHNVILRLFREEIAPFGDCTINLPCVRHATDAVL